MDVLDWALTLFCGTTADDVMRPPDRPDDDDDISTVGYCTKHQAKYDAFLHDGRDIMCAAMIIESRNVQEALEYAIANVHKDRNISVTSSTSDVLRVLFGKHADAHGLSVSQAVRRWLPKFEGVYGDVPVLHELAQESEIREWKDAEWTII
jgi:hypothetical protein